MPQVFHKSSNVLSRASIVGGVLAFGALIWGGASITRTYGVKVGVPLDQPIPFSHKHHAKELGIDCRYCHTSVETSNFAGFPPTETCMSCHSQVWTNSPLLQPIRDSYQNGTAIVWNKVNTLPDFVYFNHSIHIAKGIGCTECHGNVHEMPITYKAQAFSMLFCLTCHRQPERFIRPKEEVFNIEYKHPPDQLEMGKRLVQEYGIVKKQLTDCWICHR